MDEDLDLPGEVRCGPIFGSFAECRGRSRSSGKLPSMASNGSSFTEVKSASEGRPRTVGGLPVFDRPSGPGSRSASAWWLRKEPMAAKRSSKSRGIRSPNDGLRLNLRCGGRRRLGAGFDRDALGCVSFRKAVRSSAPNASRPSKGPLDPDGRRRSEGAGRSGAAAQATAPTHHRAFEAWRPRQGTAHPTGVEDRFLRRHAAGPPIVAVGQRPGQPELGPIAGPVDLRRRGCVSNANMAFTPFLQVLERIRFTKLDGDRSLRRALVALSVEPSMSAVAGRWDWVSFRVSIKLGRSLVFSPGPSDRRPRLLVWWASRFGQPPGCRSPTKRRFIASSLQDCPDLGDRPSRGMVGRAHTER